MCLEILDSVHYVPTGNDIARFLETIFTNMSSSCRDKPSISLSTMRNAALLLFSALGFKYNFKPTRQESSRIDTLLDTLVKEGKLTTGLWRKCQHIGIALVRLMGQAWFTSCLTHGCRSWDVAISRFLAISLMACTAGRAGDIARSRLYTGSECLRWEHIELVLPGDGRDDGRPPTIQDMTAKITLVYEKGFKCVGPQLLPPPPSPSLLLNMSRNVRKVDKVALSNHWTTTNTITPSARSSFS